MSVLEEMGVSTVSGSSTVTGDQNPEGDYEDRELVAINHEILKKIGGHPYLPVPDGFLDMFNSRRYIGSIREIVSTRMAEVDRWAFKDPLTASLLPLWIRVFNTGKISPIYLLAVRDPAAVAISMNRQYDRPLVLAELIWLIRVCDALFHTGGNCMVVHYEDFFSDKAESLSRELQSYIYPEGHLAGSDFVSTTKVKPALNRSAYSEYQVQNPLVRKLYLELSKCRGADFDRAALMNVVLECRSAMHQFGGWAELALTFYKKSNALRTATATEAKREPQAVTDERLTSALEQALAENADFLQKQVSLEERLQTLRIESSEREKSVVEFRKSLQGEKRRSDSLVKESSGLRVEIQRLAKVEMQNSKLFKDISDVRQRLQAQRKKNDQLSRKLFSLKSSTSYQFSLLCVKAVRQPGKNTVMLPFRVLSLIVAALAGRK
ncbi:hypothetical protein I5L51_08985 [Pseudomonas mendocina]|nr:hypothetical protein [Pseudomonas mendocina]MBH3339242.1 hypothetical protein [Pseudomonas mendocina]